MAVAISHRALLHESPHPPDPMAISVPAPMARPTSARARAGASLMPSPTMMVQRPCPLPCSSRTPAAPCPWGSTWASTRRTPTWPAMAWAVTWIYPRSAYHDTPVPASCKRLDSLPRWSGFTASATAIIPSSLPLPAQSTTGLVLPRSGSSASGLASGTARRYPRPAALPPERIDFPLIILRPSSTACTPPPAMASKSVTGRMSRPRSCAAWVMARGQRVLRRLFPRRRAACSSSLPVCALAAQQYPSPGACLLLRCRSCPAPRSGPCPGSLQSSRQI